MDLIRHLITGPLAGAVQRRASSTESPKGTPFEQQVEKMLAGFSALPSQPLADIQQEYAAIYSTLLQKLEIDHFSFFKVPQAHSSPLWEMARTTPDRGVNSELIQLTANLLADAQLSMNIVDYLCRASEAHGLVGRASNRLAQGLSHHPLLGYSPRAWNEVFFPPRYNHGEAVRRAASAEGDALRGLFIFATSLLLDRRAQDVPNFIDFSRFNAEGIRQSLSAAASKPALPPSE